MHVFAYCCASFAEATRKAAGVEPLLSPPMSAGKFSPKWLEGRDLLYFDLHGQPGDGRWYGDDGTVALTATQIRVADLTGTIVFAINCYLADEDSPMLDALLHANVRYVIGGDGKNYGLTRSPRWAGMLGLWFRRLLEVGFDPLRALALAKKRVRAKALTDRIAGKRRRRASPVSNAEAVADTLAFRAYYRGT